MRRMLVTGSEWRRWDLHVHTPGTILNNQFRDWHEYLSAIEAQTAVRVIGVTDYMSIANYSKLKLHKAQGRIRNIDLLIPNIEFRVAPPTEQATAVNIHVLVSPDDPSHEQEILNSLGRRHRRSHRREALNCFAFDQKPRERCVWMTTKPAFPALGASMSPAWVHGSPRVEELALPKSLKSCNFTLAQGCHPVDVGLIGSITGRSKGR
jgi:hypothetical protein